MKPKLYILAALGQASGISLVSFYVALEKFAFDNGWQHNMVDYTELTGVIPVRNLVSGKLLECN